MTPERLAELLAERLRECLPAGFRVEAKGAILWYHREPAVGESAGTDIRVNFDTEEPLTERIRWVSELALGDLQDFVDEQTASPWPGEDRVPRAHAEVSGSKIHLWYGDTKSPTLNLRPIDID